VSDVEQDPYRPGLAKRLRFSRPVRWLRKFAVREPFAFEKQRLYWRVLPYTMSSYERLNNAYELACAVERDGVPGALVECGVFKGGCAAVMGYVARRAGAGRALWLFDSFEGLPEPTAADGAEAAAYSRARASGKLDAVGRCVGPLADVRRILFETLRLDERRVLIRQGWFQQTLPAARAEIGPIALLRLDGDWYESTRCCLEQLYDAVVPGGYVILDDYYCWEGCRKAFDEFAAGRGLAVDLVRIDEAGAWFRKAPC
jgi:hypothetical protein